VDFLFDRDAGILSQYAFTGYSGFVLHFSLRYGRITADYTN
jgi:hypothetical protein